MTLSEKARTKREEEIEDRDGSSRPVPFFSFLSTLTSSSFPADPLTARPVNLYVTKTALGLLFGIVVSAWVSNRPLFVRSFPLPLMLLSLLALALFSRSSSSSTSSIPLASRCVPTSPTLLYKRSIDQMSLRRTKDKREASVCDAKQGEAKGGVDR